MDLRSTQLKDTYGNLVTTGTTAGAPTTGGLQNGQGTLLTSVGINTNSNLHSSASRSTLSLNGSASASYALGVSGTLKGFLYSDNSLMSIQHTSGDILFEAGGSEKMRIDSSGNVGIGTNTPSAPLSIDTGTTGTLAQFRGADTDLLNIDADSNAIVLDARNVAYLGFEMQGSERMRIDSSGYLLVTTTDELVYNGTQTGTAIGNGYVFTGRSGDAPIYANRISTDGDIIRLRKDGSAVGSIASVATGKIGFYGSGGSGAVIDSSGNVGIGTSPDTNLHIYDASGGATLKIASNTANAYDSSKIQMIGGNLSTSELIFGDTVDSDIGRIIYRHDGNSLAFDVNAGEKMRIDSSGNLLVGTTATPTSSAGNIVLKNGTAPTGNATDGVILYAEDVSTSSELKVRDEAGNVTTLSPHNFSLIPDGASEPMAWAYYSERDGKKINVDMLKLARMVESLTGEKLVYEQ